MHNTTARKPVGLENLLSLMAKDFCAEKCWIERVCFPPFPRSAESRPWLEAGVGDPILD
jgi:hypothetical protein